jgi:hypothetical protein
MMAAMIELFCESFQQVPRRILLDIDDTEDRDNPQDHTPSMKQVVAAWAICLGVVGSALGLTIMHQDGVPDAVADSTNAGVTANPRPLGGVHIPEFAIFR